MTSTHTDPAPGAGRLSLNRRTAVLLGGVVLLAAALAVGLILASRSGSSAAKTDGAGLAGVSEVQSMLAGIPQQGTVLGSPTAPVTLVEYADLQCPICAQWAVGSLPTIVADYVRPGKVRLVFRGLAFIGPDSDTALRTALATAGSNHLWQVVDLLFHNQGAENKGWVTDALLRNVLGAAGADAGKAFSQRSSGAVVEEMKASQTAAQLGGIGGTPSFQVGRTGGALNLVQLTTLAPSGLTPALDAALAAG